MSIVDCGACAALTQCLKVYSDGFTQPWEKILFVPPNRVGLPCGDRTHIVHFVRDGILIAVVERPDRDHFEETIMSA